MPVRAAKGDLLHDRYRIDRIIGQGGYGCIYLAEDTRLSGRFCAIKQVSYDASLPSNLLEESRDQFLKEATVLARLDHPNLPKVSDYFSIGEDDYLVMDYVPGDDLPLVSKASLRKRFWTRKMFWIGRGKSATRWITCTTSSLLLCTGI